MSYVSPRSFALLQRLRLVGTWVLLVVLLLTFFALFRRWTGVSWRELALPFLVTSVLPLSHAIWMGRNEWNGFISKAQTQWQINFSADAALIAAGTLRTVVPLSEVARAELVADGAGEESKGAEDQCLILFLSDGPRISIPGSADGFQELQELLRARAQVSAREL